MLELDPAGWAVLALGAVALAGVVLMTLLMRRAASLEAALRQLDARAASHAAGAEEHARNFDARLREIERGRVEDVRALGERIERRLGDLRVAQVEQMARFEADLVGRMDALHERILDHLGDGRTQVVRALAELREDTRTTLAGHQTRFELRQGEAVQALRDTLAAGLRDARAQVGDALARSAEELGRRVETLTRTTDTRLERISGQVESRLAAGFEKTTATFSDVLERLALIDEAQKRITELSSNVVGLQEVLADKRSRGAFGEVQLAALVRNVLPDSSFALQHTLSNQRIADCVLFLPPPTGNVAIDAKFPLESYQRMTDTERDDLERRAAERVFKQDIRKHVEDIAERYVVPGETADGAVMFIPAEAVFAEIQARHPDLVSLAHRRRVWMASPTTLMAILNTARAVLKDEATRQQVHVIREHLAALSKDFDRFTRRMDNLARHIRQANRDVDEVNVTARKISSRFDRIEAVDVDDDEPDRERIAPDDGG